MTERSSISDAIGERPARGVLWPAPLRPDGARALGAIGILMVLLIWAGAARWWASPIQLPDPLAVAAALRDLAADGDLWANTRVSLARVLVSLLLGGALAVPLGLLMGLNRRVETLVDPLVELLRPISGIAWIPLALFIFGVGDALPIFILVYVSSFQFLLATVAGVKAVDPRLTAAARTMGVGPGAILLRVVLPSCLPHLTAGLRLAFAAAWSAIVAAELIGAPSGVGFAIEWYRQLLTTPKVFAFIAVIGAIGIVFDALLRLLQERLAPAERRAAATAARPGRKPALAWSLLLPAAALTLWQVWSSLLPGGQAAPSPARVLAAFGTLAAGGQLPAALLESLARVLAGFALALALAVPLGFAMGTSRPVRDLLTPAVEGFRPIAPMAILPVAILWLGTGTPTACAIVAYAAFFPILAHTVLGVTGVDRRLLRAARTMGISGRAIRLRVVLPGALPSIMLGARIGMGVAWTAIIAAELAVGSASGGGGSGGIGQMMFVFYAYSVDLDGIVVCMIAVGLVALAIDRLFRLAEQRLTPWRFADGR
ncbi:ABC transporter permease [Methylobacterium sp. JK268]